MTFRYFVVFIVLSSTCTITAFTQDIEKEVNRFKSSWGDYILRKSDTLVYREGDYFGFVNSDLKLLTEFKYKKILNGGEEAYIVQTKNGYQLLDVHLKPITTDNFDEIRISVKNYFEEHGSYSYSIKNPRVHIFSCYRNKTYYDFDIDTKELVENVDHYVIDGGPPIDMLMASEDTPTREVESTVKRIEWNSCIGDRVTLIQKNGKNILSMQGKPFLKTKKQVLVWHSLYAIETASDGIQLYQAGIKKPIETNLIDVENIKDRFLLVAKKQDDGRTYHIYDMSNEMIIDAERASVNFFSYEFQNKLYEFFLTSDYRLYNLNGELLLQSELAIDPRGDFIQKRSFHRGALNFAYISTLDKPLEFRYSIYHRFGKLLLCKAENWELISDGELIRRDIQSYDSFEYYYKIIQVGVGTDSSYLFSKETGLRIDGFVGRAKGEGMNLPYDSKFFKVETEQDETGLRRVGVRDIFNRRFILDPKYMEIAFDRKNKLYVVLTSDLNIGYVKPDGTELFE